MATRLVPTGIGHLQEREGETETGVRLLPEAGDLGRERHGDRGEL